VQRINSQVIKRLVGMPLTLGHNDHLGTLNQGLFLPGVAVVDDVLRSLAVCAGDLGREDGGRGTKLTDDLDAVCQGR
jgi:hypothetical protein